ncbi:glycosyltransferase [Colwellia sp. D2M02]|uniref:glycosyltransferase family 2 protein n=1 Tax=Colwellia sp. D2M02 TaxID=2841562 RepID=UPI001C09F7E5|nr:glycosyltransferase family 2 protein [Colwellia sp. D2M02]MBU2892236.1 glycosyltransferase [Colwellia sp. D2M02]
MNTKLTVITPVLNGINTIADCIASVKAQNYKYIEHIIIDGNSTDGTVAFVLSQGLRCVSENDTGVYDAFNKGILMADGDVIHILNADDCYAHEQVVSNVMATITQEESDLCHGYIHQVNSQGNVVKRVGKQLTKNELLQKMRIAHPSVFVRKSVYDNYGRFSQGFKVAGDHEFLLRVWSKVRISFIPEVLVNMRLGGLSNSQVSLSYRESMAAALIHGANPLNALARYYLELLKNKLLSFRSIK